MISDTDNDFESFVVLGDDVRQAAEEWEKVEVDLADYNKKDVYVAIQYIGEKFKNVCLMVDDIRVNTELIDGVEELTSTVNIYPNPVENELFLATDVSAEEISIYDIYGRQVLSQRVNESTSQQVVDVTDLNAGVYFVKLKTDEGDIVRRFIKK